MPDLPDTPLPRQQMTIVIQGFQFELRMPYAAGHILSDIEAGVLNREWTNGVRANFAERVKEVIAAGNDAGLPLTGSKLAALQNDLQAYAESYSFKALIQKYNSDPVVREAHKLAKGLLDTKLNSLGLKRETYGEARYEEALSRIMNNPEVVREASARIEQTKLAANALIGLEV